MAKRLIDLLQQNYNLPIAEQKDFYKKTFENYKGENEQTDDILLIGIKI